MGQLTGKTALITGASRGIGHAIATRFAAEGAAVVLCASRLGAHGDLPGTLEGAVAAINASGGRAAAEVCDLLDPGARADLVARASAHFGPIDILVNNAAGSSMNLPSLVTTEKRNLMHDLNLNVPMELAQQALPGMRERGAGWILSISSATVNQPLPPYRDSREAALVIAAYGASKAAPEPLQRGPGPRTGARAHLRQYAGAGKYRAHAGSRVRARHRPSPPGLGRADRDDGGGGPVPVFRPPRGPNGLQPAVGTGAGSGGAQPGWQDRAGGCLPACGNIGGPGRAGRPTGISQSARHTVWGWTPAADGS